MGCTELTQEKWITRYFDLAEFVATWSKDNSTKVGAVIVDERKRIVSVGFNGPPIGVIDDPSISREAKLYRTIHAEENAILFANSNLANCTIYVTQPPCAHCTAVVIQSGIKHVRYKNAVAAGYKERWKDSLIESNSMFTEANIDVQSF
jgi:dCMP deaminase